MINPYALSSNPPKQHNDTVRNSSSQSNPPCTLRACASPSSWNQNGDAGTKCQSPVVKNPYAASSSPSSRLTIQQQKRTHRPWEENMNNAQPKRTCTKTNAADPFDDGFDWSSALGSIDAVTTSSSSVSGKNSLSKPCCSPSQGPTTTSTNSSQEPVVSDRPVTGYQSKPKLSGGITLPSDLPPRVPGAKGPKTLASLRPDAWLTAKQKPPDGSSKDKKTSPSLSARSTPVAAAQKSAVVFRHPYGDERQAGLPKPLQFDPQSVQPVEDDHYKTLMAHARLTAPLKNGWTLFPHQIRAIKQSIQMRRCILALDMGLGKTVIGCIWARSFLSTSLLRCKRAIVLCPVSLQKEWTRTAEDAAGIAVVDPEAKAPKPKKPKPKKSKKKKIDVIDTDDEDESDGDDEDNEAKPARSFVSIHSWGKLPDPPDQDNFVVVADEAHSIQNMASARTKATLSLVLHERCIGVLLLTGTPMKNGKPSNLFPLLRSIRHPLGNHQRAFEAHFCQGREIQYGKGTRPVWQASGSANLDQLRVLTQSHMLYLTKEECLEELPPQTRMFKDVPVSSRLQAKHDQAIQELVRVYKHSKENKGEPNEAVLGAVQRLRMIGSLAKVDATVQYAKKILEDEPAIVIFTSFQEVARQVHQKLAEQGWDGELLTGETPPKKRQAMVDSFQNGLSPTFVCTFGAGGVGLTLTAARTVVLLDRPWTPGDAHQAEDRVRRIGQTHAVKSVWMRAFEIDRQMDDIIAHKTQTSSVVLTEGTENGDRPANTVQRISINKLLDAILPANLFKQTSILQFSQPTVENEGF